MSDCEIQLAIAGVNFRHTPLETRNKFALTTDRIKSIYSAGDNDCLRELFILSTCNRTEIYSSNPVTLMAQLSSIYQHLPEQEVLDNIYVKTGDEAINHLFKVASGLDSQILGDQEIIGQIKNAFALAKAYNKSSGYLEKMVNAALQASRAVKSRTKISDGTTSVSYAVIQLLRQLVSGDKKVNVSLIGLGKIGTVTLKNLKHYLPGIKITVVNRNNGKAEQAALDYGVNYAPFHSQEELLAKTDVLIVATAADHAIISKEEIERSHVKLIFDLAVPSNVSKAVREIEGVKVFNIDELSQIINQTIERRKNDIPMAEAIINEYFAEIKEWERKRALYGTSGNASKSVAVEAAA
jgi:glutamyl-tRNA reductase